MKIEECSNQELQRMRFVFKKLETLALFFEEDQNDIIKQLNSRTVPPTTFVHRMSISSLEGTVLDLGYEKAAKFFGVSPSFLKKEIKIRSPFIGKSLARLTDLEISVLAGKIESPRLFYGMTGRRLKRFKEGGEKSPSSLSEYKGQLSEEFYAKIRGAEILRNLNKENIHSPWDFDDAKYGRVNVKSSRLFRSKKGECYWKFSTSGDQDYLALIGWDEKFVVPLMVEMVKADQETKSITVKMVEPTKPPGRIFLYFDKVLSDRIKSEVRNQRIKNYLG